MRRARLGVVGLAGIAMVSVSACQPALNLVTSPIPEESGAVIDMSIGDATEVSPSEPLVISTIQGRLVDVTVTGPKGPVQGQVSQDGTTWVAKQSDLKYGTTYQVNAEAVDYRGRPITAEDTFTTLKPSKLFSANINLPFTATGKVGVGTPLQVEFSRPVKDRAAVERGLVVETPKSLEGAWAWRSDSLVEFRPKKYWPGNIDVTVQANMRGVEAAPGVFGEKNATKTYQIGDSMVSVVDSASHSMAVYKNGKKIKTLPITTGKPGFETRSGTKLIITREPMRIMDAASGGTAEGDPEYYRVEAPYAMRITYSGEFVHAAPWSVGSQGYANVSHGCVGMSTGNAYWLFENSKLGDVVTVKNTGVTQGNDGNGVTVWNDTWKEWLKRSKAGPVMTVATKGDAQPLPTDVEPDVPEEVIIGVTPSAEPSPASSL